MHSPWIYCCILILHLFINYAIMVKYLAEEHKRRDQPGRDSNPHSDAGGIQTHILTPPELESDAPDREATTLKDDW